MGSIVYFIKKELLITFVSVVIFIFTFYLYKSQSFTEDKINQIEELKSSIKNEKTKLKKIIEEYKKEKNFEYEIKGIKIIDEPMTLDIYKEYDKLKKVFYSYFGTNSIRVNFTPTKLRVKGIHNYVFYSVNLRIPYVNKYEILDFFNFLKQNYFYTIDTIKYSTKTKVFVVTLYLLGKKNKKQRHRRLHR